MVHALHEAWRVLVSQGVLVDLRPFCTHPPLEVVSAVGCETAGRVDMSLGWVHDLAAEAAIQQVVVEGIFREIKLEYFDCAYYRDSFQEMKEDLEDCWKDDIIPSEKVYRRAATLFEQQLLQARARLRIRMKIGSFTKSI